jgi:aminopeptidase N
MNFATTPYGIISKTYFWSIIHLMKIHQLLCICASIVTIFSCKPTKNIEVTENRTLPEIIITPPKESANEYRGSNKINFDLIHTQLKISFDWKNQYLIGKATLTLAPHFYSNDFLWLDARGMEIKNVELLNDSDPLPLIYTYKNDSIGIRLNRLYNKREQFKIAINYVAKPEELKDLGGSAYITSDKGLYFINPLGKDPDKPKQIWTQGETQSNSVWFPTIDSPNQKTSQEISITVDSVYKTLSNGILTSSISNKDGTRTDIWKQKLPHAPYLMMMAIGNYAIVKDEWHGKEVSYYVEPAYEKMARKIFGNTPEMLTFFSEKFGVDFPWDKYSQVVVRDYVSGAMENSSATVMGEFMQRDERELVDATNEYFIAHELTHQWFGDLVTCESWANTPLNESFATYGEYLWDEFKYGREIADVELMFNKNDYLRESGLKQVDLIRFYYEGREDMFDHHSYEKGGCVLHMLRKYVGDDAFFASLRKYLDDNKFKAVEIHQLRLAFEEVTGEDLNWFFNEWFLNKGHPQLEISYAWNADDKESSVIISQKQDLTKNPLYKIPLAVDIYESDSVRREQIVLTSAKQIFTFHSETKPELINVDAEKMLLGIKNDKHTPGEWITLYKKGPLFADRYEAIKKISSNYSPNTVQAEIMMDALSDRNWKIRETALDNLETLAKSPDSTTLFLKLKTIAETDKKSILRAKAIEKLDDLFHRESLNIFYKSKMQDSSYIVMKTGMDFLMKNDPVNGMMAVKQYESVTESRVIDMLTGVYSRYGNDEQSEYMFKAIQYKTDGFSAYSRIQQFGKYLSHCEKRKTLENGLLLLLNTGKNTLSWYKQMSASQALADLAGKFDEKKKYAELNGPSIDFDSFSALKNLADKYGFELKAKADNQEIKK